MINWVEEFRAALTTEPSPWIATLATVDAENRPRARSVVCRNVEDDGIIWLTSDSRSDKHAQLVANPAVEIVFWLAKRSEQYRVAGTMAIVEPHDSRRHQAWAELSDRSRSMFFWPAPGTPRVHEELATDSVPADQLPAVCFSLLLLRPERAEFLDLKTLPHRRRRWECATSWTPEELHP